MLKIGTVSRHSIMLDFITMIFKPSSSKILCIILYFLRDVPVSYSFPPMDVTLMLYFAIPHEFQAFY